MSFFQIHSPDGTALQSGERRKQRKNDALYTGRHSTVIEIGVICRENILD